MISFIRYLQYLMIINIRYSSDILRPHLVLPAVSVCGHCSPAVYSTQLLEQSLAQGWPGVVTVQYLVWAGSSPTLPVHSDIGEFHTVVGLAAEERTTVLWVHRYSSCSSKERVNSDLISFNFFFPLYFRWPCSPSNDNIYPYRHRKWGFVLLSFFFFLLLHYWHVAES